MTAVHRADPDAWRGARARGRRGSSPRRKPSSQRRMRAKRVRFAAARGRSSSCASTPTTSSSTSTTRGCASASTKRLLDIANTYLGMWAKLEYVDVWYTPPSTGRAPSSQRWHRDFNDRHLLKAFLYLVDVDEETGPFEYVPRTAPGQRARPPLAVASARRQLSARRRVRCEDRRPRGQLHCAEGHADLLQHLRLPPRRLRDGQAARPGDGDVLVTGVACVAHRAELHDSRGRLERARPEPALRAQLKNGAASTVTRSPRMYFSRFQSPTPSGGRRRSGAAA